MISCIQSLLAVQERIASKPLSIPDSSERAPWEWNKKQDNNNNSPQLTTIRPYGYQTNDDNNNNYDDDYSDIEKEYMDWESPMLPNPPISSSFSSSYSKVGDVDSSYSNMDVNISPSTSTPPLNKFQQQLSGDWNRRVLNNEISIPSSSVPLPNFEVESIKPVKS